MESRLKLVAIDVGNTSTAAGLWSGGRVSRVSHCDGGFDEAAAAVTNLLATERGRIAALAYVSVVPKVDRKWRAFAKAKALALHQVSHRDFPCGADAGGDDSKGADALERVPPESSGAERKPKAREGRDGARPNVCDSIAIDYPEPATIGADRLADAAGAVARYGAPVLVMDFGTALTAALVTCDRVWRGGVIAPGFPLMRDYLFERTAKLPRMEIGSGKAPKIGRSTEEAMRFGALVGYRGMVREIVTELRRNFSEDFRLVATGGFAHWVLDDLDMPFVIDPTLTLYGAGLVCSRKV